MHREPGRGIRFGLRLAGIMILTQVVGTAAPVEATTLFGLVSTGELYSSTNSGATWSATGAVPLNDAVGLAAGTSTSDLYMAGRSGSVYHSTNGGSTWAAVGAVAASDVAAFVVHYDGAILVLTRSGTIYRSTNQGSSFSAVAVLTGGNWVSLARGPLGRLYVLTQTGEVAESQDGGTTWATVGAVTVSNAVSIHRRGGSELAILMATGEVARSVDYGRSWVTIGSMAASNMAALVESGSSLVAAASTGEVATSTNGASWTWVGAINQLSLTALGADTPQATGVDLTETPPRFLTQAPYPNPRFGSGGATFSFTLPQPDAVRIELFDIRGRLVATRQSEGFQQPGVFAIRWEPAGLAAGDYIVRLMTSSGRASSTKWTIVH